MALRTSKDGIVKTVDTVVETVNALAEAFDLLGRIAKLIFAKDFAKVAANVLKIGPIIDWNAFARMNFMEINARRRFARRIIA